MTEYDLVESFVSINGEGRKAGELALFMRFKGCNLNCSWCDTKWANVPNCPAKTVTVHELVGAAENSGVKNITLTGGEPLLQQGIEELIAALINKGFEVEIETNGSVPLPALTPRPSFTMDYKLPSSGMEEKMCLANLPLLSGNDTIKFVCGSRKDLETAEMIISTHGLAGRCAVYLSPVFGKITPSVIVDFMKEKGMNNVRLQLQLHKFIWPPEARGV